MPSCNCIFASHLPEPHTIRREIWFAVTFHLIQSKVEPGPTPLTGRGLLSMFSSSEMSDRSVDWWDVPTSNKIYDGVRSAHARDTGSPGSVTLGKLILRSKSASEICPLVTCSTCKGRDGRASRRNCDQVVHRVARKDRRANRGKNDRKSLEHASQAKTRQVAARNREQWSRVSRTSVNLLALRCVPWMNDGEEAMSN